MTTERPILMSAPMVRAILAGTKTQTRRVVKDTGLYAIDAAVHGHETSARELLALASCCPYGQPGHKLWVREAWRAPREFDAVKPSELRAPADGLLGTPIVYEASRHESVRFGKLRPGMFMPRWASRILLEVTEVRVERLQAISEADARAEGAPPSHSSIDRVSREFGHPDSPRSWYAQLWDQINGAGAWDANPWVWAVSFRVVKP